MIWSKDMVESDNKYAACQMYETIEEKWWKLACADRYKQLSMHIKL